MIGTVTKITEYGAYVHLDEYGIEAFAPVNEVVTSYFRRITEYLREGQKAVFKVIKVDRRKKIVDVSLKRVSDSERKTKWLQWKRAQRAKGLIKLVAERVGKDFEELVKVIDEVGTAKFGDALAVFEVSAKEGIKPLVEAGIPEDLAKAIYEVAKEHIRLPEYKVSGILKVVCLGRKGVDRLREILTAASKVIEKFGVEGKVYVVGVPRYRIDVVAKDPKLAEEVIKEASKAAIEKAKELGCEAVFERL